MEPSSSNLSEDDDLAPPSRGGRLWGYALAALAAVGLGLFVLTATEDLLKVMGGSDSATSQALREIVPPLLAALLLGIVLGFLAYSLGRGRREGAMNARLEHFQKRLAYREDLLKLVADHRRGAIAIFDRHNRYWFVNGQAATGAGRPVDDIIGKPPIKVLGNEAAKKLEVRLAEARAAETPVEYVDQVVQPDGSARFIQSHYEPVSPFAELSGGVVVSEDDLTNLIVERERRERMLRQVMDTLVAVVDRRDPYAAGHSARVGQLAGALAREMGLDRKQVEAAEIAGSLMNFGKVLVSRSVLTKTTPLTAEELQRVRDSILTSADILSIIGFDAPVVPTLRQVLERYDGQGVPEGLAGEAILTTAQIVAVANAFVALVSPRAHRDGLSLTEAVRRMAQDSGKAYSPRVLIALSHYVENRPAKLDWLTPARPD